ncbi:hypothetical protein QIS74_04969 [Colletotrichum tabaci]|uniref:Uncharacterized protein n=1 Tax=Colletotrichum tabaci TaxID=1209068 RepID=A0AAV9TH70_9PEZI
MRVTVIGATGETGSAVVDGLLSSPEVTFRTAEDVEAEIAKSKDDPERFLDHYHYSYHMSCDIKGENTPEYARYLGYLVAKDLYPDLHGISFEDFVKETLEKGLEPMYEMNRDVMLKYGTLAFRGANAKDSA